MKSVFTTGQVAKICKVAPRTASKWFDAGRLKGYRIPGSLDRRIPRDSLIAFLKEAGMPLGELETEQWHKVLTVGLRASLENRLRNILTDKEGFRLESGRGPFDAGMITQRFHPDTVIIDLSIGRSDSLLMAQSLRRDELFITTFLIALAGEDETALGELAVSGFNCVFQSPFDVGAIASQIRQFALGKGVGS